MSEYVPTSSDVHVVATLITLDPIMIQFDGTFPQVYNQMD